MRTGWVCLLAFAALATASAPALAAPDPLDPLAFLADPAEAASENVSPGLVELNLDTPQPSTAQTPNCPVAVACVSSTGGLCGIGLNCVTVNLGPCCIVSPGLGKCCLSGNILVTSCPCVGVGCPSRRITVQWCV